MIKCPFCKSKNIVGFQNVTDTYKYKLDKDGNIDLNKPLPHFDNYKVIVGEGYSCEDCGTDFTWRDLKKSN